MAEAMLLAKGQGFEVSAVVATRHASEVVSNGRTLIDWLAERNLGFHLVDGPEKASADQVFSSPREALGLCFGPAWVFPPKVLTSYTRGMFNFNGIPIPRYLGGAHYTWQILNNSRESGRFIQKIERAVDKGDIYMSEVSTLGPNVRVPADFFRENHSLGLEFVETFLNKLSKRESFHVEAFAALEANSIYFPRLDTAKNGWVDWSWAGREIESFCNGFSHPYEGVSAVYRGDTIRLREVMFHESAYNDFHPVCHGLVVRASGRSFFVSVRGGLLEVLDWSFPNRPAKVSEGYSLAANPQALHQARTEFPKSDDLN